MAKGGRGQGFVPGGRERKQVPSLKQARGEHDPLDPSLYIGLETAPHGPYFCVIVCSLSRLLDKDLSPGEIGEEWLPGGKFIGTEP